MKEIKLPPQDKYFCKLTWLNTSPLQMNYGRKLNLKNMGQLIQHCWQMCLKSPDNSGVSFLNLTLAHFITVPSISWSACIKYTKVKLELPTAINMFFLTKYYLLVYLSYLW